MPRVYISHAAVNDKAAEHLDTHGPPQNHNGKTAGGQRAARPRGAEGRDAGVLLSASTLSPMRMTDDRRGDETEDGWTDGERGHGAGVLASPRGGGAGRR